MNTLLAPWRAAAAAALLALCTLPTLAAPLPPTAIPEPLKPWVPWVLHGHEQLACPRPQDGQGDSACVWPARLALDVRGNEARFTLEVQVLAAPAWVLLPGEAGRWPQDVQLGAGQPLPVVPRDGRPAVQLPVGSHVLTGRLQWPEPPQNLQLPTDVGSLQVQLDGQPVVRPPDDAGRLWLRQGAGAEQAADTLTVRTARLIEDDIPLRVTTRWDIAVAGRPRELVLPHALLPGGFVPESLQSALPARLGDGGALRLQVRPGNWVVQLRGRLMAPVQALTLPAGQADEVWAFAARNELRVVTLQGLAAVDPKQMPLPPEWQAHPTYLAQAGQTLRFAQTRRGNPDPGADRLTLARQLWLDFDGGGFTVQDRLGGQLSRQWRLEVAEPALLGRASESGQDQPVTRLPGANTDGVELRRGRLALQADSRLDGARRELPATGWKADFQSVRAELNLPPGWQLLHASGVDQAQGTWVARWTLWDFFFVLLSVLAAARLLGPLPGVLLAAALVLTWHVPDAPRAPWLVLLGFLGLARVLPAGRWAWLERAVHGGARATVAATALLLLPYAVQQIRQAVYPGLEQPHRQMADSAVPASPVAEAQGQPEPEPERDTAVANAPAAAPAPAPRSERLAQAKASAYANSATAPKLQALDPTARVQTGPGLPAWQWRSHALVWQGPVQAGQTVQLLLLPPAATALWRVAGLVLLVLSLWVLTRPLRGGTPPAAAPVLPAAAPALLLLAVATAALLPLAAQAAPEVAAPPLQRPSTGALPDAELLEQLRQKLQAPPDCLPQCAHLARLRVLAQGAQVQLRLELHAQADTMVPLPGQGTPWRPASITQDGRTAPTRRDATGQLWAHLRAGVTQLLLAADVGEAGRVEIALPMPPQEVQAQLQGWTLAGLDARGQASGALSLVREAPAGAASAAADGAAPVLPPFLLVQRTLNLGLQWSVTTRVSRLTDSRAPARARIALLPGEAVNSEVVRVEGGHALVQLGADDAAEFTSTLAPVAQLRLDSTTEPHQIEAWQLEPAAQWHVAWSGIAPVHLVRAEPGQPLAPQWQPWPGEAVELRITKPAAAAGQTVTLDRLALAFSPGLRATDVQATGRLRSSQGSNHRVTLPEGVEFLGLWVDGQALPIRPQGRELTVPITPGEHQLRIDWREPRGLGWRFVTTPQGLGAAGANAHTLVTLPPERVVLATGGPPVGPAVLLWGVLVALAGAAVALARTRLTPLGVVSWFLLGLGLAQAWLPGAAVLAGWFFAMAARRRLAERAPPASAWAVRGANAMQVLLLLWTLAAAAVLLETVRNGLLGFPDMMVLGNGSDMSALRWYQDRFANQPEPAWVVSAPVLAYRLLMLGWALWLAASVLTWVRWGWDSFSAGGLWRRMGKVAVQG